MILPSLQANAVVLPFATTVTIRRSEFTTCPVACFFLHAMSRSLGFSLCHKEWFKKHGALHFGDSRNSVQPVRSYLSAQQIVTCRVTIV